MTLGTGWKHEKDVLNRSFMSTFNIGLRVNRAISGGDTVGANCYAMVTYAPYNYGISSYVSGHGVPNPTTMHFGPGQSIPASYTYTATADTNSGAVTYPIAMIITSGVELINGA